MAATVQAIPKGLGAKAAATCGGPVGLVHRWQAQPPQRLATASELAAAVACTARPRTAQAASCGSSGTDRRKDKHMRIAAVALGVCLAVLVGQRAQANCTSVS